MSKEIEEVVSKLLEEAGFKVSVSNTGPRTKDDNWECDSWLFTLTMHSGPVMKRIKEETFEYFTGTGHRKVPKHLRRPYYIKDARGIAQWTRENARPVAPHVAGLIHSVILDGYALETNFMDWALEMGTTSDSIKALNTYNACCEIARRFQNLVGHTLYKKLQEALQDY